MPATRELLATLAQAKASLETLFAVVNGVGIPVLSTGVRYPTADPYYADWATLFAAIHSALQAGIYVVDSDQRLGLKEGHEISARRLPAVMKAAAQAAGVAARLNPGLKRLLREADPEAGAEAAPGLPSNALHTRVGVVLDVAAFLSDVTQLLLASLQATAAADVFLIASGGVVLMDSGLEAIRLAAGMGDGAPAGWQLSSRNALNGVGWLFRLPAQGAAVAGVAGLRQTVLRPEAILGYLRAFPAAMAAVYQAIPEAEAGSSPLLIVLEQVQSRILCQLFSAPALQADLAALARDAALQRATAEGLFRAARRLAALGPDAAYDEYTVYDNVYGSLQRLNTVELRPGLLAAFAAPDIAEVLLAVVDVHLSRVTKDARALADMPALEDSTLFSCVALLEVVLQSPGGAALPRATRLKVAGRAAAAVAFLAKRKPVTWLAGNGYVMPQLIRSTGVALSRLADPPTAAGRRAMAADEAVTVVEAVAAFDSVLAAATMLAQPAVRAGLLGSCRDLSPGLLDATLAACLKWTYSPHTCATGALSYSGIPLSAIMDRLASLVQTWSRCVLVLSALCASPPAGLLPGAWPELACTLPSGVRELVPFRVVKAPLHVVARMLLATTRGAWSEEELSPQALLRWRAAMLGFSTALEGFPRGLTPAQLGAGCGTALFWSMVLLPACMPGVPCLSRTAAAGDEVAGAAKQAFDLVLGAEPGPVQEVHSLAVEALLGACRVPESALSLSRAGVLSSLARWAERQCGQADEIPLTAVAEGVLESASRAVTWAVRAAEEGAGLEAPAAARRRLLQRHPGERSYLDPLFWQGVRTEVAEPLAAELAAAAAAAPDAEAHTLARAVADTKALASLPCANPDCTAVLLWPPGVARAPKPKGKKCSGCEVARYCGAACQKAHWGAGHKAPCRELKRLRS